VGVGEVKILYRGYEKNRRVHMLVCDGKIKNKI